MALDDYIELAAADQWECVESVFREEWYKLLSEPEQADFWTRLVIELSHRYHITKTQGLSKILDGVLPGTVHEMLYANIQQSNHSKIGVW